MPEFTTTGLVSLLIEVLRDEAPHLVRQLDRPDPMDQAILPDGLKRHLVDRVAAEQRTFSGVLRRARMRVATQYLSEGQVGLAEIGFCCGYADQAHFQRDFLRAANVTPGVFRTLARGGQSGAG